MAKVTGARTMGMKLPKVVGVFALVALLPVLPYLWKGYAGHDFLYHVSSWLGVVDAWRAGQMFPTWSAPSNFGLGDPRFCFYPPVSLLLGGLLTWALPALISPGAFIWACFLVAGLAMYFACRGFVAEEDRVRAAMLYVLGPYFLMSALVRFAAAELLVQAWLPFLAVWLYEALWRRDRRALLKLAGLLGLSWLTDVPATIMLLYGLAPATAVCAWRQRSVGAVVRFAVAEALGALLAAFYLVPVWIEKRWINMGGLLDDDPRWMLLFARAHGGPQPNYVLGAWLFVCGGAAAVAVCLWARPGSWRGSAERQGMAERRGSRGTLWICLAAISILFQLPVSGPLWRYMPELAAVQFPYRFLPLLGLAVPFLLFGAGAERRSRWPVYALTAALSIFPFFAYARAQTSAKMRTAPVATVEEQWRKEGYMGKPEYVQPGVTRPVLPPHLAGVTAARAELGGRCEVLLTESDGISKTLKTVAGGGCTARLATYYYPYWAAADELGTPAWIGRDASGLMLVGVPQGSHTVRIAFHPVSIARKLSLALSGATSLFVVWGWVWLSKQEDVVGSQA